MTKSGSAVLLVVAFFLGACSTSLESATAPPRTPSPRVAPTATPLLTPTPTRAQLAERLKQQLLEDQLDVRESMLVEGGLLILTIPDDRETETARDSATAGSEPDAIIATISRRVAALAEGNTTINAVSIVLMGVDAVARNTEIDVGDMVAWAKHQMTDEQYRERWRVAVNNDNVTYSVSGAAERAELTYVTAGGIVHRHTVHVPWHRSFPATSGQRVYVLAMNIDDHLTLTCEIFVAGVLAAQASAEGRTTAAPCVAQVP